MRAQGWPGPWPPGCRPACWRQAAPRRNPRQARSRLHRRPQLQAYRSPPAQQRSQARRAAPPMLPLHHLPCRALAWCARRSSTASGGAWSSSYSSSRAEEAARGGAPAGCSRAAPGGRSLPPGRAGGAGRTGARTTTAPARAARGSRRCSSSAAAIGWQRRHRRVLLLWRRRRCRATSWATAPPRRAPGRRGAPAKGLGSRAASLRGAGEGRCVQLLEAAHCCRRRPAQPGGLPSLPGRVRSERGGLVAASAHFSTCPSRPGS
jgi:hypothetical protein